MALASERAASSVPAPPRYHHSQPMKTNDTPTQTSDQMAASRVLTRCAPCLLIAKKSTSSATSTNAANKDHMSGEPMDCMTAL